MYYYFNSFCQKIHVHKIINTMKEECTTFDLHVRMYVFDVCSVIFVFLLFLSCFYFLCVSIFLSLFFHFKCVCVNKF